MSAHVPPHRWADAWAGKVDDAERAEMERHVAECARCRRIRTRITRASDSFATIRTQTPPELSWDSVRARVHWSVSSERRASRSKLPRPRPVVGWAIAGVVAAAGAVAVVLPPAAGPGSAVATPTPARESSPTRTTPPPVAPTALAGLVNRVTGDVLVGGIRPDDLFTRRLVAGDVIVTGDGRVDVQFGESSGFALGPRSRLVLRTFDSNAIELVVDGVIDVEVAPRASAQRFSVIAGERVVEVRGTQFRVRHDATATEIACRHGLVAVRDPGGQLELGANRHLKLAPHRPISSASVATLSSEELASLVAATPMTVPLWDPETLAHSSAPLEIATAGRREVRVDGVELGAAPLRVRVMPGRHTVEAADSAGRFRRAGWVDVTAPTATPAQRPARLEVPAEPPPTRGIAERRRQLRAGLDHARLAACTRALAKQGLTGAYVQLEITVDAAGNKNALNIVDTDLGQSAAECVRDALNDVTFGAGAAATWRERIDL